MDDVGGLPGEKVPTVSGWTNLVLKCELFHANEILEIAQNSTPAGSSSTRRNK